MYRVSYTHLAALGSSFASGPGITPMADAGAMRSSRTYPHLLAERLGAELTDLSIGGATTATILDTPQRLGSRIFPPQIDALPADADLVTITAGGNDLRYARSLLAAGWGGWFEGHFLTRGVGRRMSRAVVPPAGEREIERAASGLARIVEEVRARAPRARVLLVDYLTVFGADTMPSQEVPLAPETIEGFRRVGRAVDEAFARAAEHSAAELVKISELSAAHAVGSPEPWVVGFAPTFRGITAFHPNAAGMAAVAGAIEKHLALVD
jgi:lysophospholipase L1-like esterase